MKKCIGRRLIVKDLDVAEKVMGRAPGVVCVTIDGVIRQQGSMTGGWKLTANKNAQTPIQTKYAMDRAHQRIQKLETSLRDLLPELHQRRKEESQLKDEILAVEGLRQEQAAVHQVKSWRKWI